jgi:hypothetical protein
LAAVDGRGTHRKDSSRQENEKEIIWFIIGCYSFFLTAVSYLPAVTLMSLCLRLERT